MPCPAQILDSPPPIHRHFCRGVVRRGGLRPVHMLGATSHFHLGIWLTDAIALEFPPVRCSTPPRTSSSPASAAARPWAICCAATGCPSPLSANSTLNPSNPCV